MGQDRNLKKLQKMKDEIVKFCYKREEGRTCLLGYNIPAKAQTSPYGQKYNRYCMSQEFQQKTVTELRMHSRGIT